MTYDTSFINIVIHSFAAHAFAFARRVAVDLFASVLLSPEPGPAFLTPFLILWSEAVKPFAHSQHLLPATESLPEYMNNLPWKELVLIQSFGFFDGLDLPE